jgi:glucose/mannose-6-phosphate isomerase
VGLGTPSLIGSGALDSLGIFDATTSLPEQVAAAIPTGRNLDGLPDRENIEQVVVLGMGGSGIAGDVLVAVAGPFLPLPVTVVKSYELPDYVGRESLVFAISFSGDTEETVEAAGECFEAGASLVAVTSGGELKRLAEEWGAPVVDVPRTIPQPRCAIGAMSIPPMIVLEDMGLFPGATGWVELAVEQLSRRRDRLVLDGNEAEQIARRIGRTIPLVYGGQAVGATAASRWKTQVNENAKSPAFSAVFPELGHNELAGWGQNGDVTRQVITLINLRHDAEHPQVSRRFAIVSEMLREVVSDVIEVRAQGEGDLAQLLDLILIGDFVSLYLAAAEGVDPGPIPILEELKDRLKVG